MKRTFMSITCIYITLVCFNFLPYSYKRKQVYKFDQLWQPLMDPEDVIALFDSCWLNPKMEKKRSIPSIFKENPNHQFQKNQSEPKISKLPSILMRSKSEQLSSMTRLNSDFLSPHSVLFTPHLQTILSVKEVAEQESIKPQQIEERLELPDKSRGIIRNEKSTRKSLSDLEFEELKGFMDLGFVFSEEDKDSSLVEIIPGLQRLGKKNDEEEEENVDESSVSRPYLSEAWQVLERRKRENNNPLMNWRVPAPDNEIDMKDSLKSWAHTVASAVR